VERPSVTVRGGICLMVGNSAIFDGDRNPFLTSCRHSERPAPPRSGAGPNLCRLAREANEIVLASTSSNPRQAERRNIVCHQWAETRSPRQDSTTWQLVKSSFDVDGTRRSRHAVGAPSTPGLGRRGPVASIGGHVMARLGTRLCRGRRASLAWVRTCSLARIRFHWHLVGMGGRCSTSATPRIHDIYNRWRDRVAMARTSCSNVEGNKRDLATPSVTGLLPPYGAAHVTHFVRNLAIQIKCAPSNAFNAAKLAARREHLEVIRLTRARPTGRESIRHRTPLPPSDTRCRLLDHQSGQFFTQRGMGGFAMRLALVVVCRTPAGKFEGTNQHGHLAAAKRRMGGIQCQTCAHL